MSGGIVGRQVTVVGGSKEEEEKEEEKEGEEEDRCARARPPPATWQRATLAKHGSHSPPFTHLLVAVCVDQPRSEQPEYWYYIKACMAHI